MTFIRDILRSIAIATLCIVASCGGGGGGGGGPSTSQSTGDTTMPTAGGAITLFSVDSKNTGIAYPITVYVPAGGDTGTPTPVIYLLDAETRFSTILPVLQASGVRATLVAVSNTGADRRQVDFLEPGADPYYAFLTQELKPLIESKYHVDPSRSVLSGHSSGGLFAMYAFFKDTPTNRPYFAILAEDGSYWQQP
ncbi:MAG TPA: alpha/beta hydrolase-fold protein, partial [Usitatibacter sp.]